MKIVVVYGPPCSGKSTYVQENMDKNDVRYDYDALARALNGQEEHYVDTNSVRDYVVGFRFSLLSAIAKEKDKNTTLYFITNHYSNDLKDELKECSDNITLHEIKATKQQCLDNLNNDNSRPEKEEWKKRIEEYFKQKEDEEKNKDSKGDKKTMDKSKREYRSLTLETRKNDNEESEQSYIVEGYATTFGQPYCIYKDSGFVVNEQVDARAFDECDVSDVIMQYDHKGRVFARNKNGTLEIKPDNVGLMIRANLGGTDIGKQLYEEIKGGYTDKMSFGFTVAEDKREETYDRVNGITTVLRTITKVGKLYDVSAVSIPANDTTTISARNFSDGLINEIKAERLQRERLKLKLKTKGN